MIEEENKTIAGVLCTIDKNVLSFRRTGVLNGDEQYIKRGASSAQYYFTLKFALEHGIAKIDLMRSRPFFKDGVYDTKRKWGAKVFPDDAASSVCFFIPEYSRKVSNFFELNPLIVFKQDKMYGLVGWNSENFPSAKDNNEITRKYHSAGLEGLMLLQPNPEKMPRFLPHETYR